MANAIDNFTSNLKRQLEQSSIYQSVHNWYSQLGTNDQSIVKVLLFVISLVLIYAWIWQPAVDARDAANKSFNKELSFHESLKENAYRFKGGSSSNQPSGGSILSIVSATAKAKKIELRRFEPDGATRLRIWLDKAEFDAVIDWIEILEAEKGILVEQISLDKVSSGRVNVRAVLTQ
ncbi:type II secretion system protein M [Bermanella marisrubri]|uniref:Type II secretion system protein M n=1 Tax=Bermanella marisrubri TaxID=207949 RepID=Q1N4H7_9GAMM|nr:type II secretion system protein M [Bermanella marisrubri]EAT13451.1 Type II secretory pathway, component PulM [Oceanobacter sp. RED65] [Bermanella marisrubri]QIZ84198.1 type II secretion system protein M [Bermanella marisrubri]